MIDHSLDKLKAVVYFYKERVLNPPVEGGCPIQNTSIEVTHDQLVLQKKVHDATCEWHRRIVSTLEKGIARGEVSGNIDASEFAMLFIGMIEGGLMGARIWNSREPFDVMSNQLLRMIEELKPAKKDQSV